MTTRSIRSSQPLTHFETMQNTSRLHLGMHAAIRSSVRLVICSSVLLGVFANTKILGQTNPPTPNTLSTSSSATQQTFIDPRNGRPFRYKEVEVDRLETEWVTDNQSTTQIQYQPTTQYELATRVVGRWNPFANPRIDYEYVPRTTWSPQSVPVNYPVRYPKYVVKKQTVLVPEYLTTNNAPAATSNPNQASQLANRSGGLRPSNQLGNTTNAFQRPTSDRANLSQMAANQAAANRNGGPSGKTNYPLTPIGVTPGQWQTVASSGVRQNRSLASSTPFRPIPSGAMASNPIYAGTSNWPTSSVFGNRPLATAVNNVNLNLNRAVSGVLRPARSAQTLPQTASRASAGEFRNQTQSGQSATVLR